MATRLTPAVEELLADLPHHARLIRPHYGQVLRHEVLGLVYCLQNEFFVFNPNTRQWQTERYDGGNYTIVSDYANLDHFYYLCQLEGLV